ncbi:MAG: glycosyl hydrolase 108 family protein [Pseudomonadota bacterium]|nr:glycosyl hydrolase 108 family protein [Pseudomonadota bacterium]
MSDRAWRAALEMVLEHEGGFVIDPDDPGGATNFGISIRFLRAEIRAGRALLADFDIDGDGDLDPADMEGLSREGAAQLYRSAFWDRYALGDLPPILAPKVFDLAVNMGPRQAFKLLQRALRAAGAEGVVDDGVIGPLTRAAISEICATASAVALIAALRSEAAGFYRALIAAKPRFEKYRRGWLARAYA